MDRGKPLGSAPFRSLLPSSIAGDASVRAAADSLDRELQAVTEAAEHCVLFARLDELPGDVVDHLAWQLHVDFYDTSLPVATRRELVRSSFITHARKGTPWAVERLAASLLGNAAVREWDEYGGEPHRFRVETDAHLQPEEFGGVIRAVTSVKNVRSWLDSFRVVRGVSGGPKAGGLLLFGRRTTIGPRPLDLRPRRDMGIGGVLHRGRVTTITSGGIHG